MAETLDLETIFNAKHGTYVLRMKGDSQAANNIVDGDYVIIAKQDYATDGDFAVVQLDDGQWSLRRYSSEFRTMPVHGVLIGVLRCIKNAKAGVIE